MKPQVSIVMPTFNNGRYLQESIQSVLSQSFQDWELVVVNDASKDNSREILQRFASQDPRIKVFHNEQNLRIVKTLNRGLDLAQADLIARLDGDDYWSDNEKLRQQVDFLNSHPDYGMIGSWGTAMDENGKYLFDLKFPSTDAGIRSQFLMRNCFIHSSLVFRKKLVLDLGGYVMTEGYIEDYELWLKLGMKCKFALIPKIMVSYRINSVGLTQSNALPQLQAFINLSKKHRKDYPNYRKAQIKLFFQKLYLKYFGTVRYNSLKLLVQNFYEKN